MYPMVFTVEMGIDFVGVGGYKSYLPFLWFAESLNIPWLILSDSENTTVESVKKQFRTSNSSKKKSQFQRVFETL
jgi:hypothetical protein